VKMMISKYKADSRASLLLVESQDLVLSLAHRQEQLERTQSKFIKFQLAFDAFNFSRTNRLALAQRRLEGQIIAGKVALAALENSLDRETIKVSKLQHSISEAEIELAKVKHDLESLEGTIKEQNEQLLKQGKEILHLSNANAKREAVVEALVFLLSLAAVRSSVVNVPLSTMLVLLPPRSRVTTATRSVARLAMFLVVLRYVRGYAVATGWTSDQASFYQYLISSWIAKKD